MRAAHSELATPRLRPAATGRGRPTAPTVVYKAGLATGVLGLEVSGVFYDVRLVAASYDDAIGHALPTFFGRPHEALRARDALVAVFNSEPAVPAISAHPFPLLWTPFTDDSDPAFFVAASAGLSDCGKAWRPYEHSLEPKALDFNDPPVQLGFMFATYHRCG